MQCVHGLCATATHLASKPLARCGGTTAPWSSRSTPTSVYTDSLMSTPYGGGRQNLHTYIYTLCYSRHNPVLQVLSIQCGKHAHTYVRVECTHRYGHACMQACIHTSKLWPRTSVREYYLYRGYPQSASLPMYGNSGQRNSTFDTLSLRYMYLHTVHILYIHTAYTSVCAFYLTNSPVLGGYDGTG